MVDRRLPSIHPLARTDQHLMAFRDSVLVFSQPGALNAAGLEELIAGVENLNMDDVRASIAAR